MAPRKNVEPPPTRIRTRAESYAAGKALREKCPRDSHATWKAPRGRRDPVETVVAADKGRLPDLLPLRHGRMVRSPFTFYRGSALAMAADLASTPSSGIRVQCCGDAHLSNFGGFATPERKVLFSINDLDETLPAPWEWDVKRLAASFVAACRDIRLPDSFAADLAATCVRTYRESMDEFSQLKTLELWYQGMWADDLVAGIKDPAVRERALKRLEKERAKSIAEDIFPKLVEQKGEMPMIKDQLPTIFHRKDVPLGEIPQEMLDALVVYRSALPVAYQSLLDRFELRDAAVKVVGVGSVGTYCFVLLFMAGENDPLFLQVKEARASVLEPVRGQERLSKQRAARRAGLPAAAAGKRHLPRMVGGAAAAFLHPPIARHQDQRPPGDLRPDRDGPLRDLVRARAGAVTRAVGILGDAERLHGQERRLRQGHHRLLDGVRGSERERPRRHGSRGEEGDLAGGVRRGPRLMLAWRLLCSGAWLGLVVASQALAQDLDPRAYVHVPVNSTFLVWGLGVSEGGIVSDPSLPVTGIQATVVTPSLSAGRSFSLFGRTAQAFAALPFAWAEVSGNVLGVDATTHRAGLSDMRMRLSWLVRGAPAASVIQLAKAPRRTILGTSLNVVAPAGEYHPDKAINLGTNRWSFRPEFAVSQPLGQRWLLDTYAGISFFTANNAFYPGTVGKTQAPIGSVQLHLSYNFQRQLWAALDVTYYAGGRSTIDGVEASDLQSNLRTGVTIALPIGQRHSIKIAVSRGLIVQRGTDFTTCSFAWQTAWVPRPPPARATSGSSSTR